jgi:gliding motility-associated-like protein
MKALKIVGIWIGLVLIYAPSFAQVVDVIPVNLVGSSDPIPGPDAFIMHPFTPSPLSGTYHGGTSYGEDEKWGYNISGLTPGSVYNLTIYYMMDVVQLTPIDTRVGNLTMSSGAPLSETLIPFVIPANWRIWYSLTTTFTAVAATDRIDIESFSGSDNSTWLFTDIAIDGGGGCEDLTIVASDTEICFGDPVTLTATSTTGGTVTWDGGVTNGVAFTPVLPGTYTYTTTSTSPDDCPYSQTITVIDFPTIDAGPDLEICLGEDVTLTATGVGVGGVYVWDGGVVNGLPFGPLATITYTVVGTTPEGCFSEDEVTITVNPSMTVSFTADELIGCAPFTVNFTSLVPGAIYNWNFGDGGSSSSAAPSHTYLTAGEFSVTLNMTNASGCSGVVTYLDYITVIAQPIAAFTYSPTQVDVTDTEVQFTNQSLYATSYTWDFGDGAAISNAEHPIHVFPETGNVKYTVILTATNELGCVDVVQKVIEVKDVLIYYLPNSFTPDGDTYNELFSPIFYSGMDVYDFHFTIFNRWGELVFESFNTAYGWNGAYGDQGLVQDGVYIWRLEFGETMSDKKHTCEGHVTLIR